MLTLTTGKLAESVGNCSEPVAPPGTAGVRVTPSAVSESPGFISCGQLVTGVAVELPLGVYSNGPATAKPVPDVVGGPVTETAPLAVFGLLTVTDVDVDAVPTGTWPKATGEAPPSGALAGLPNPSTAPQLVPLGKTQLVVPLLTTPLVAM